MDSTYYSMMGCIERSYRLFLELIKKQLDRYSIYDINNVQALMIYNIADQEVSVGELTSRGLYQGSNVSYNLKKLIQTGYIIQTPSEHDKRSFYIRLSDKGKSLLKIISGCIQEQDNDIARFFTNKKYIIKLSQDLESLEGFLVQQNIQQNLRKTNL